MNSEVTHEATVSNHPWKYPAMRPETTPMIREVIRATSEAATETCVAASSREKTSRPALSLPRRCSGEGGARISDRDAWLGS